MEQTFRYLAVALAIVAIYLLWSDPGSDYTFFVIVITICAGFLSYRFRLKDRVAARRPAETTDSSEE